MTDRDPLEHFRFTPLADLDLPDKLRRLLQFAGYVWAEEVAAATDAELMALKDFGRASLLRVRQALQAPRITVPVVRKPIPPTPTVTGAMVLGVLRYVLKGAKREDERIAQEHRWKITREWEQFWDHRPPMDPALASAIRIEQTRRRSGRPAETCLIRDRYFWERN